jgi:hypothetical protein
MPLIYLCGIAFINRDELASAFTYEDVSCYYGQLPRIYWENSLFNISISAEHYEIISL